MEGRIDINEYGQGISWKPTFHYPDYCPLKDKRCGKCYHLKNDERPCSIEANKIKGIKWPE